MFKPCVCDIALFKEIALNVVNPLEIIREAISNSVDAESLNIDVIIDKNDKCDLVISIKDNGKGMDLEHIHKFFDLGHSIKNKGGIV